MRFSPRFKQRKSGLWMFDDKPPAKAFGYRVSGFGAYANRAAGGADGTSWKFLNASNQHLSTPDHADFDSIWDSDFCIEYWINHITINGADRGHLTHYESGSKKVVFASNSGGDLTQMKVDGENSAAIWAYVTASSGLTTSTWQHVRHDRSSGTVSTYIDGVSKGSGAASGSVGNLSGAVHIGERQQVGVSVDAYMDEIRISNISRAGGSDFTPPSAPFEVDANTISLIHCGELVGGGTFTDTAGTHVWTLQNTPTQDTGTFKF